MSTSVLQHLADTRFRGRDVALLLAAVTAVYATTWDVPFTWDDLPQLVDGNARRSAAQVLRGCPTDNRCVGNLTFAANFMAGGLEVGGYHAVNVAVHAVATLVVYGLVLLLLKTPRLRGAALPVEPASLALGVALLFAVHPLQTMAVTYIIQRFASLMACLYLLSVAAYTAARLEPRRRQRLVLLAGSLAAAALAMKTKQNSVTLPVTLVLVELVFFEGSLGPRLGRLVPWVATLALPLVPVFTASRPVAESLRTTGALPRLAYLATELAVIPAYLRLLVLPVGQSIDHDPPRYDTPLAGAPLAGGLLLTALVLGSAYLAWRPPGRARALLLAGAGGGWFFVTLAVESSVVPIQDVMVEHRLYLPSFGFFLTVVTASAFLFAAVRATRPALARGLCLAGGGAVLLLGLAAFARNQVWRDTPSLWLSASALAPNTWRPLANAAQALMSQNRCPEALHLVEAALARGGQSAGLYLTRARCRELQGDVRSAALDFERAIQADATDSRPLTHLARLHEQAGGLERARQRLERAIEVDARAADARARLGSVYGQLGRVAEGRTQLERALAQNPTMSEAWNNLGNVRGLEGDLFGAAEAYRRALALDPRDLMARENLARVLERQGKPAAAREVRGGSPAPKGAR